MKSYQQFKLAVNRGRMETVNNGVSNLLKLNGFSKYFYNFVYATLYLHTSYKPLIKGIYEKEVINGRYCERS